ncbi:MAG: SLBB domain-containing protein [Candidatus Methylomirabilia bacterium]
MPSPIELAFEGIAAPSGERLQALRQFGYDFFRARVSTFAPVDDVPVGPDYILGPGDDLTIYVWGQVDNTLVRTVDRNGQIFLPKVGALRVWGLSFSQADYLIRQHLGRYFRGFNTSVTLGRLRTIRVNVVGEVKQPGTYTIGGLSTLTNALAAAGGPSPTGSLRNIRLLRNQHVVGSLDFYDYLLRGDRTRDFRLESGDTIFVPPIGPVAGILGEVKRPAIYELKGHIRLADLVDTAGGFTPRSYLKRVQVIRARPSAERVAVDLDLTRFYLNGDSGPNIPVQNGDLVRIFTSDPRIYNTVTVAGSVKYPGDYQLKEGMRISQLLTPEIVLPEAHLSRVEVVRRGPDLATEIIPVDLREVWKGERSQDLVLKPLDRIAVRTELRPARSVTLSGEVKRPGEYSIQPGERLSSVLRRAGGFTERAYLTGAVFTRASLREIEQEQLNAFMRVQEERLLAQAGETVIGVEKEEAAHRAETIAARRELLHALANRVTVGRMVVHLDHLDRLEGTADDIVLDDGDTLLLPQRPSSVLVIGAVRNPTSVRFKEGADVTYYLNRVGGLTKQADRKEIHIVKADGSALSGFARLRSLEPGDTIIVPPKEEKRIRALPAFRDVMTIVGQSFLSIAALLVLF